jgi:MOSC domain-containing protein YiiM
LRGFVYSVNVRGEGGVPKLPVRSAKLVIDGVEGDFNKFRTAKRGGSPARAVCIYSLERIEALQEEGHPISLGTTGENLTIEGLDWSALEIGMRMKIGKSTIELTEPCAPCNVIADSFKDRKSVRIDHDVERGWSRWLASVIDEGIVAVGDFVGIIDIPSD